MIGYIYKIKSPLSSKCYIGQTIRNIQQRFKEHIKRDSDTKLAKAFIKYGAENFNCELVEKIKDATPEKLNQAEEYWIKFYDSYNNGYNMTLGGFNLENAVNVLKKPIEKRNKDTYELIQVYESVSEAARELDAENFESIRKNICKCCNKNELHEVYGYRWNFVGEPIDKVKRGEKRKIPVLMCDLITGEVIREFPSAKDASLYFNKTNGGQITACCKGKNKTAYNYIWKYKE